MFLKLLIISDKLFKRRYQVTQVKIQGAQLCHRCHTLVKWIFAIIRPVLELESDRHTHLLMLYQDNLHHNKLHCKWLDYNLDLSWWSTFPPGVLIKWDMNTLHFTMRQHWVINIFYRAIQYYIYHGCCTLVKSLRLTSCDLTRPLAQIVPTLLHYAYKVNCLN